MLEHVHHRVPVTALAFYKHDVILAGEGGLLRAYDVESKRLLASLTVLDGQAIHGVLVSEHDTGRVLVYGGCFIRVVRISRTDGFGLSLESDRLFRANDWILDAAYSTPFDSGHSLRAAFVTAHNALVLANVEDLAAEDSVRPAATLDPLVPGSNCLLYSAHIAWLSGSHCLIASGTAFGDVIVWSCFLSEGEAGLTAHTQTHYAFSAHEGSIFGVRISGQLGQLGGCKRALSSCSDDRTIAIWDVSDLTAESPPLTQLQRDTGFGSKASTEDYAPACLAKAMGHVSRIWHVRFLVENAENTIADIGTSRSTSDILPLRLMSFGEDASNILWAMLKSSAEGPNALPYQLQQVRVQTAHSGKHIWALTQSVAGIIVTGGADGAIAIRHPSSDSGELGRDLGISEADTIRAYGFVDHNALVCTTNSGQILLLNLDEDDGSRVKEVSPALAGLRGYSIVTAVPGYAFIAGTGGTVYAYALESKSLTPLVQTSAKVAGLFARMVSEVGEAEKIAVLVTLHEDAAAQFLLVPINPDASASCTVVSELELNDDSLIVTSFTYIVMDGKDYAVVGSRDGFLSVFDVSQSPGHPIRRCAQHGEAHGKETVTDVHALQGHDGRYYIHSTGRDGTHVVCRFYKLYTEKVHQLALPFGPNIEGLSLSADYHLRVWGFRSTQFVVYDATESREIMTVDCGGAHRNWAYQPHPGGGTFVWTKASKLYRQTQTELPYQLIGSGGHGREITAAVTYPAPGSQIIATGAEDTNIKLFLTPSDDVFNFRCVQTLRKHNTGIQHLMFTPDGLLFSSGGFEEFFVWRIRPQMPGVDLGVVCESTHPRAGTSDLRIMGFNGGTVQGPELNSQGRREDPFWLIDMIYSDSSMKRWKYQKRTWKLHAAGDYMTACQTHVQPLPMTGTLITGATDGHIANWTTTVEAGSLAWSKRHKVHQNAILSMTTGPLSDGSSLVLTGGDDNAIGITRWSTNTDDTHTLVLPRAHAAAVTALAAFMTSPSRYVLLSASIDQCIKMWLIDVDVTASGVDGVKVTLLHRARTAVADVSSMQFCALGNGGMGVLVCGVGMDVWRFPMVGSA